MAADVVTLLKKIIRTVLRVNKKNEALRPPLPESNDIELEN